MYKTIYAVIDYKDLTDMNERPQVIKVTTDFDEAKKIFDSEYAQSYNPSAITMYNVFFAAAKGGKILSDLKKSAGLTKTAHITMSMALKI